MFSPYSNSGFYQTPVSKGLLGTVMMSSFAINFPFYNYRHMFVYPRSDSILQNYQIWRLLTAKIVFLDFKDLLCGAFLFYYFRIFERRFGSQKFCSYLLGTTLIFLLLELAVQHACHHADITLDNFPSGPFCLLYPFFVPYFCDVPRVVMTHFLGTPVTGKSITYIIGLQLASSSPESVTFAICGTAAGLLYRLSILRIQQWCRVPDWLSSFCHWTLGRLLCTPPPPDATSAIGATLELQRQQHIERLEQQMAWAQFQLPNQRRPQPQNLGRGLFGNLNGLQQRRTNHNLSAAHDEGGDESQSANFATETQEEQVRQLVEMGFNRDSVLQALQLSNNDINRATNVLLQQT